MYLPQRLATDAMHTSTTTAASDIINAHFWNDQTALVDMLFPDAEDLFPDASRWLELKAPSTANVDRFNCAGLPVLRYGPHAWVGLDKELKRAFEVIGEGFTS